ncbi:DNA phosphorothioation-associated putative methyltransferase [Marinobacter halodurans]|uniref:DNA phosphorothioation-associated putative methyltransferase n=1 Tax=Marinobacter halodurans TaxID=2528979 RepID=A0ABY1ZG74_9GAMM|nr:DNA phosphorothioation-associated putative methyltransferase [Marinobacter halodurans]TBW50372.1 DNA phosphorothioation-associated putative methyltransferase [Marinobacter halodurans]
MSHRNRDIGKKIGEYRYLHSSAVHLLGPEVQHRIAEAASRASLVLGKNFNVVKLSSRTDDLTLLNYPTFFEEAFPTLEQAWKFDLETLNYRYRVYLESNNPPILHRKELLLAPDHNEIPRYSALTKEAEGIGLFDDTKRIGFLQEWERLLKDKGYEVIDHSLIPIANQEADSQLEPKSNESQQIHRHLTALTRTQMSAPMQSLARYGYLDGSKSIFDYGCGKGGDLQLLKENGVQAAGWDPYYAPNAEKEPANIVNMGFVINVIEDVEERSVALQSAFGLAEECLVISAMLENANARSGIPYKDGVRTSRNTFQKYFSQLELAAYIEATLGAKPVPVAPGVFYAFKTYEAEADFFHRKNARCRTPINGAVRRNVHNSQPPRMSTASFARKYENNSELLEKLWSFWLELGREPKPNEVEDLEKIRDCLGSYPSALKILVNQKGEEGEAMLKKAQQQRNNDLIVQLAEHKFYRKPLPRPLPERFKEDLRHFFGNQANALAVGEEHLVSILDKVRIHSECVESAQKGIGWLDDGHSLQLHTDLISRLPPTLRIYIICASSLYGDPSSADLVKVHIRSAKLTLMKFDDFNGKAIPRMLERTKINLMNQRIDVYQYGEEFEPPNLYLKSRYLHEDQEGFSEQLRFDEKMEEMRVADFSGFGPSSSEFGQILEDNRLSIDGFALVRSRGIPPLDRACGKYFKYRDFVECGETHIAEQTENRPKQPETYTALFDLAKNLLDPIIDYFGMVQLTYGFCSAELNKKIPGRIAPKLDQHASHELNKLGNPICKRLGAAVDFIVEDEDMLEVSQWIAENLEFDRLYFYGKDRPIHLSFSESPTQQVTVMTRSGKAQKLLPRSYSVDNFLESQTTHI